ncbi:MAG TPA: Smr/MutS family protein [Patescibacteria group bacterium]|nr:Smr/MutS family protein [Patescibacteria group bacterium]
MANERRRRQVTGDEELLWRTAMRDAKPFRAQPPAPDPQSAEATPEPPPPVPVPRPNELPPPRSKASQFLALEHGRTPGVDKRTAERMRGGEMVIDGTIDLHGLCQDAAHLALLRFVAFSAEAGRRCVLVITGKGTREGSMGVLRAQVPRWLNEPSLRPHVLAFSYARPKHGAEGALYVLLKRRR